MSHMSHVISDVSHVLITVPVYWPWHAPAKSKRGNHFGVQECIFSRILPYRGIPTPKSHRPKLGLRSTSSNAIKQTMNSPGSTTCTPGGLPSLLSVRVLRGYCRRTPSHRLRMIKEKKQIRKAENAHTKSPKFTVGYQAALLLKIVLQ